MTIKELIIKLMECENLNKEVLTEYDYVLYDLEVKDEYSDFIVIKCVRADEYEDEEYEDEE